VTFTYNLSEGTVAKVYMLVTLRVACRLCDGYTSAAVLNIQTEMYVHDPPLALPPPCRATRSKDPGLSHFFLGSDL